MIVHEIIPRAQAFLADYRSQQAPVAIQEEVRGNVKWCAPDPRRVKINTDTAILHGDGISLEMVARGSQGQFLMAAAMKIPGRWEVEATVARAAEFGVQMAQQHNFMNLIIEVDSLGLVSKIQTAEEINSETVVICRNIPPHSGRVRCMVLAACLS
ncbi:unnamed protein product [Linum tenue]|uniref:RNase H type-1 domain-containing protein n=1 Tax=Linum tenue TaxID=586396 RepID=A0AAV0H717_9ROSI|nr:unnamed protein product [Linum tenue]